MHMFIHFRTYTLPAFLGTEIDEYYSDVKYDRIAILNALGAYYSNLGKVETKQREREEYFIRATQYYNKASRIDQDEPTTFVGKGWYSFVALLIIDPGRFMLFVDCSTFQLLHYVFPGQLLLAKGDLDQSSHVFKIVLDGRPDNVPALLGQVNCSVHIWPCQIILYPVV